MICVEIVPDEGPVILETSLAFLRDPAEKSGLPSGCLPHQHQLHPVVRPRSAFTNTYTIGIISAHCLALYTTHTYDNEEVNHPLQLEL